MTQLPGLLDTEALRKDFPILDRVVHDGKKLVYLDNAATSQTPRQVLDVLSEYYEQHNANVHRGVHVLAEEATALYEGARDKVAEFINAPSRDEVIFTKNASESLNLVANMLGWADEPYRVDSDTEIVITEMEHHSNIVPWQLLAQRTGAKLKWFGLTDDGRLDLSNIDEVITEKTKIVSFVLVSNILGTQNPVEAIVRRAQQVGALVCIDASQAAPHMPLDVQALQADFVAFTGHKMCGPTGIGVLWGRQELLEDLPPFLGGGEMIETVSMHSSTYAPAPHKFEAGTPPVSQAIGLGAAIDYLNAIGMDKILAHEHALTEYAVKRLLEVPDLRINRPDHGRGARSGDLLHPRGHPPARRGPGPRRAGHRGPGRPPLRAAGLPAVRNSCDHASVVLSVLHAGRDRRAGRRPGARTELLRLKGVLNGETGLHVPGSHPGPLQEPARAGLAGWRRRGAPRQPDVR
ncbi:cysteine desulfurase/selenocysteine lyase [Streptomyces africanus]|uniref:cysteine desulfurase n=1 Tax=Streptomyces africanus TaxID=231024 RepID=A0ABU0QJQ6_9ACTN|nr:cysteine desulfurase/selenocysteine lyase [Streptomyces africanus]